MGKGKESLVLDPDPDQFEEQFVAFDVCGTCPSNPVQRRPKGNENSRRFEVLSLEYLSKTVMKDCTPCRNTYCCPHNKGCRNQFGSPEQTGKVILKVRNSYYPENGYPSHRQAYLLKTLSEFQTMVDSKTNQSTIRYRINNVDVCKSFYRLVSGVPIRMFNETVAAVEGTGNERKINRLNKYLLLLFFICFNVYCTYRLIDDGTVAGACASHKPDIIQRIRKAFRIKNNKLVYLVNEESVNKVLFLQKLLLCN